MNSRIFKASSIFLGIFLAVTSLSGQGVYFDPSPTDVTAPARLYVDVTSPECNCPELLDVGPDNPLYIWAWNPNEQRTPVNGADVTNGSWTASNSNLVMTQDETNPNLWYFDFLGVSLVEFYDQPAAVFYDTGIDFLVKEESGAANDEGAEQKSPDINVVLDPPGCFEKVCPFPTTFFQDEYFVITYDNNQEQNPALQNMGPDEGFMFFRVSINGAAGVIFREESDKYKMRFEGDGIFSLSMYPEEYFELSGGDEITNIEVFITKPPITSPPFTSPIVLVPGCE